MRTRTWKKRVVAIMLAFVMVMGTVVVPVNNNCTMVEAATKKDKKKPKLTMEGNSKMTVTKGKSVTIPKTTAKDNKDGNVTKKIKVTVKKGKKSYSSIAKKIKNNKSVKFTATGKYVITYTVTDKAGNKATKKRYVTVKNKQNTATTTEEKTEQATTETPTTEQATTEDKTASTTEATTQEDPKPETPTVDLSKYASDLKQITVNGNTYNVASAITATNIDTLEDERVIKYSNLPSIYDVTDVVIGIGNDSSVIDKENLMFYFLGEITAKVDDVDLSSNVIFVPNKSERPDNYNVYVITNDDRVVYLTRNTILYDDYDKLYDKISDYYLNANETLKNDDVNKIIVSPIPNSYDLSSE